MSRKSKQPRGSGRAVRVGDQIQRELAQILAREVRDPRLNLLTLTHVDVTADYSYATVYFTCFDADQAAAAAKALNGAKGVLRRHLAPRLTLYAIPDLRFVYDESVERGARLSRLIDEVNRKPD